MSSLNALQQRKQELQAQLREVERQISVHPLHVLDKLCYATGLSPETIKDLRFFGVSKIENWTGTNESRKNLMELYGHTITFENGTVLQVEMGSNWCSEHYYYHIDDQPPLPINTSLMYEHTDWDKAVKDLMQADPDAKYGILAGCIYAQLHY